VSCVHNGRVGCWLLVLTLTSRRILATGPAYARGNVLSVLGGSWLLSRYVPDNCKATIRINGELQFNLVAVGSWSCKLVHSLPNSTIKHRPPTPAFWLATSSKPVSVSTLDKSLLLIHAHISTRGELGSSGSFVQQH
jgi:hypothetical protein